MGSTIRRHADKSRGAVDDESYAAQATALTAALSSQTERFDAVLATMTEGVVIVDDAGRLVRANPEAFRMHGAPVAPDGAEPPHLPRHELFGLDGEPLPRSEHPLFRVCAGERISDARVVVRNGSSSGRWIASYSGAPLVGADGSVSMAVLTIRDVTEEHRAENERAELIHQLASIGRISDTGISTLDLHTLPRTLLGVVVEVMEADCGIILLRHGDTLRIEHAVGFPDDAVRFEGPIREGLAGTIAEAAEPRYIEDLQTSRVKATPPLLETGVRTLLGVPLRVTDEVLGVMHVGWRRVRPYSDAQSQLLELAGDRCAIALQNAALFEQERRTRRWAEALNTMNRLLLSTMDVDEMLACVVAEARAAVGAESTMLFRPAEDGWQVTHLEGVPQDLLGQVLSRASMPAVTDVAESGKPMLLGEGHDLPALECRCGLSSGTRSCLLIPLHVQGMLAGVLHLGWMSAVEFDSGHHAFADQLATAISLAMEGARLYENERRVAHTLQESLLALPTKMAGLSFSHAYHSAAHVARVGGDFYDIFDLHHGLCGLVMGDVSGKGLEAAVLTALVKNTIRAHAMERGKTPAEVVAMANQVIYRETGFDTFVTIFFGILDRRDGRLVYCNAGHPSAAIARADGEIVKLPSNSPLAGAFLEAEFEQSQTCLESGDMLLMYTDGLIEQRRGREMFGEPRLFAMLSELRAEEPEACVTALVDAALDHSGYQLRDDVALLAVKREAELQGTPVQQKLPLF